MNNKLEQSQKNLLYFIMEVISAKEEEEFTIKEVNLRSKFYTFVPSYITVGSMLIIANDAYWQKSYFDQMNVTDYECVTHLHSTQEKGGKALFLKYDYNVFQEKWKFKKNKRIHLDEIDYVNAVSFPYLNYAINLLYINTNGGELSSEIVQKTLEQIKTMGLLNVDKNVSRRKIESTLIKALNGKKIS